MKVNWIALIIIIVVIAAPLAYIIPQIMQGKNELEALTIKDMVEVAENSDEFAFYSKQTGLLHSDHARVLYDYLVKHRFTVTTKPPPYKEVLFKSVLTESGPTVIVNTDGSVYTYCAQSLVTGRTYSPKWWHYQIVTKYPVFVVEANQELAELVKTWWDDPNPPKEDAATPSLLTE